MAVSKQYVADLVADLNADKVERDNQALALAMCPAVPEEMCEYCLGEIDWMGYCYC